MESVQSGSGIKALTSVIRPDDMNGGQANSPTGQQEQWEKVRRNPLGSAREVMRMDSS